MLPFLVQRLEIERRVFWQKRLRASFLASVPAQSPKSEASSDRPSSWLACKPVDRFERVLHGERRVGENLLQDRFPRV